jgi:diguanylate cyclase (GGDEF)-like protein
MTAVNHEELGKSLTYLVESLTDILAAGGPAFNSVVLELQKLLRSGQMTDPEPVKRHAFNLSNLVDEIVAGIKAGAVEIREETAPTQPALDQNELRTFFSDIISHMASFQPDSYEERAQNLQSLVNSGAPALEILISVLEFIIRIREDLWAERSRALNHIGDILKSLEDTEKDFLNFISASQSYISASDQTFAATVEDSLMEISALAAPGQLNLDNLCEQITLKVKHIHDCIKNKKMADQARLAQLDDHRRKAAQRQIRTQRDYEKFTSQSHEMLKEIEDLRAISMCDQLTEIYNRRAYDLQMAKTLEAIRTKTLKTCGLIVFDIDHFRDFNNTYGHLAGDRVLAYVARLTCKSLRRDDIICRYGGDEFVILTPNAGLEATVGVAEKVRASIAALEFKLFKNQETTVRVTVSLGAAEVLATDDENSFFARADQALYQAKSSGRNRVIAVKSFQHHG